MCKGHFKQIKQWGKNRGTEILRGTEDLGRESNSELSLGIKVVWISQCGPAAALMSSGNSLERQSLGFHPRPVDSETSESGYQYSVHWHVFLVMLIQDNIWEPRGVKEAVNIWLHIGCLLRFPICKIIPPFLAFCQGGSRYYKQKSLIQASLPDISINTVLINYSTYILYVYIMLYYVKKYTKKV